MARGERLTGVIDAPLRALLVVDLVVGAASFAFAAVTYGQLPERYAVHFDAAGNPNGWATRDSGQWFAMPGIGVGLAAALLVFALVVPRIPMRYWNVPDQEKVLALPAGKKVPLVRSVVLLLMMQALFILVLMLGVQLAIFGAATGTPAPSPHVVLVLVGVAVAGLVVWIVRFHRAVRRAARGE